MRNLMRWTWLPTVLAVALTFTLDASAQEAKKKGQGGFGRGGFGMGAPNLVGDASVQKELGLKEDQAAKIKEVTEETTKVMAELRQSMGQDASQEERQEAMAKMQKLGSETQAKIAKLLDKDQTKRLDEIQLQYTLQAPFGGGLLGVLAMPKYADGLKLTDKQKDEVKSINDELNAKMREAFQGGGGGFDREKMAEMRKDATDAAAKVLSADQTKALEAMKGKEFDVSKIQVGGGRRGGPGGAVKKID